MQVPNVQGISGCTGDCAGKRVKANKRTCE